jgi:2-(1,2-epoxy-1,2-dihydrophenyl)acetyl-CoA isomerase
MLGERLSAEQAEQWGLIYRVVDDAALRDEALTLARQLATQPTYGLALIKRSLNQLRQPLSTSSWSWSATCSAWPGAARTTAKASAPS